MSEAGMIATLMAENEQDCELLLEVEAVRKIAKSIGKYEPVPLSLIPFHLNDVGNVMKY